MSSVSKMLSDLKFALQELESAVQQPRDERFSIEQVLDRFPAVLNLMYTVIKSVLESQGTAVSDPTEAFVAAHQRGWLKGEISLWLRLASDYQQISEDNPHGAPAQAVAQDVRACSCMLWETYELLTARFRYQTQVQPAQKQLSGSFSSAPRYAATSI